MKFNFFKKEQLPEILKQEKVTNETKENFNPIRACIIDSISPLDPVTREAIESIEKNGQFINFDGNIDFLKQNNFKNAGMETYVISDNTDKDKYSKRYCDCTGVIAVGEEKNSNRQVSFLSHQNPWRFISDKKKDFSRDLTETIQELKKLTKENSIDIVIFGGHSKKGGEYEKSVKYLGKILKKELGFDPTVITGPNENTHKGSTKVYFDTQNRRLYIIRPFNESNVNEHYLAGQLKKQRKAWSDE